MALEDRIEPNRIEDTPNLENSPNHVGLYQRVRDGIKREIRPYLVDTSAALSFYTPLMASSEAFIAGMSPEQVLKSRLYAAVYHSIFMRPYGKFREFWARTLKANPDSSRLKKFLVDTSAMILIQTPVYSGILLLTGTDPKKILVALPAGLAIGASSGRPYGYFLDRWRKLWGTKPVLAR